MDVPQRLYEETLLCKTFGGITGVLTALFLAIYLYQALVGPIGTRPAPNEFFLAMFILFLAITVTFSRLSIAITGEAVTVGYGVLKRTYLFEDIADCYPDEASAIRYGGYGIRIGIYKGRKRLAYNIPRTPRVVLLLKRARYEEVVFSTSKPEEVIRVIRQQIGR